MLRTRWLASVLCASLSVALPCRAESSAAPTASRASELFQQARDEMKSSNYVQACAKLTESAALVRAPGTLLNLGVCNEKLGKYATALEALHAAQAALPAEDSRQEFVRGEIARIEGEAPKLTIAPTGGSASDKFFLDDVELPQPSLGQALPADVGRHVVRVVAPDHDDATFEVVLQAGETKTIDVRPGKIRGGSVSKQDAAQTKSRPRGGSIPPERAPETTSGSDNRTAAYVSFGVGGAGFVVSAITGIMVLNKKSTMESHCDKSFACDQTGLDAASSGKTLSTVSTVGFVVGLVGAGAGLYFLLSSSGDHRETTAVGVAPTSGGADVALRTRF